MTRGGKLVFLWALGSQKPALRWGVHGKNYSTPRLSFHLTRVLNAPKPSPFEVSKFLGRGFFLEVTFCLNYSIRKGIFLGKGKISDMRKYFHLKAGIALQEHSVD